MNRPAAMQNSSRPCGPPRPAATLAALASLAAMAGLLAFLPALFGRTVVDRPEVFDLGNQWLGFAAFIRDCYLHHHFPLWDPHDLCGMPFLAFAHTGSLYLPWVLLHLAYPTYLRSAPLDILLHLTLAGLAAFALFRGAGRSRPAAWIGAVAYTFSGFVFGNINFPPSFHAAAWLPCWYLGAFALLERPRVEPFLLSTLALLALVLAGDLELAVYAGLGLIFQLGISSREGALRPAGLAACGLSIGLALLAAGAQVLPALELDHLSVRAGAFSFSIQPLLLTLFPVLALFPIQIPASLFYANHGLDPWYLGAGLILFASLGLRRSAYARRRLWIFPLAVLFLVLFYVPPFNDLFGRIPVLGQMIVPVRLWPVLEIFFLLAALAALDEWAGRPDPGPVGLPGGRAGAIFLLVFGAGAGLALIWIHQGLLPRLTFAVLLVSLGALALAGRLPSPRLSPRLRYGLVVVLVLADLYGLALAYLPRTDPSAFAPDPRVAEVIQNTSGRERYWIASIRGLLDPGLPFHLGLRLNADTLDAFTRVPPRAAAERLARLYPQLLRREGGRLVQYDQMTIRDPRHADPRQLDLLNRFNVTWILSRQPWQSPAPEVETATFKVYPDLYIYRNLKARPRAAAEVSGQPLEMEARSLAPDQVQLTLNSDPARRGISLFRMNLRVALADSWYPGWEARQAEREIKLGPDELGLIRFSTDGAGPITLRFVPRSFRIGLWSSLASVFGLLFFGVGGKIFLTKPARQG